MANDLLRTSQDRMLLAEKMASLGRLTAGIAHEMNSPLAAIRASVESAAELMTEYKASIGDPSVNDDDYREIGRELDECLDLAAAGVARAVDFVRSIKAQTREPTSNDPVQFDAVTAVRDALSLLGHRAIAEKSSLSFHASMDHAEIRGKPGRLEQVVTNLVQNGIDATRDHGGGEVSVKLEREGGELVLSVADDGCGIPADVLPKIFDPLFTTKPIGQGTGLGLTIVHDIVYGELGGRLDVSCLPHGGTAFIARLPLIEEIQDGTQA